MINRRRMIKYLTATPIIAIAPALFATVGQSAPFDFSPINFLMSSDYKIPATNTNGILYESALTTAILNFLSDTYSSRKMPIWEKKYPEVEDMPQRVQKIVKILLTSIPQFATAMPIDPAWLCAQIISESMFYEFAVSNSFAVGPCQFIDGTAADFKLITARTSKISKSELKETDYLKIPANMKLLKDRKKVLISKYADLLNYKGIKKILQTYMLADINNIELPDSESYLDAFEELDDINKKIKNLQLGYKKFLEANFTGRSIFNPDDIEFLTKFDQRVLPEYAVVAMVKFMSSLLKSVNGNILVATAAYNAGLGRTKDSDPLYSYYGKIPNINETSTYVSRILATHAEIIKRI